jgi:bifunctional isochorismate lyase / aryl carrier protein
MTIPRLADYELPVCADVATPKVSWRLEPARSALLIHDMQRYFLSFFDDESPLVATITRNIKHISTVARAAGVPVFYTAQPGAQERAKRGLLQDFWGPGIGGQLEHVGVAPELQPRAEDTLLEKHRYSAFHGTSLRTMLAEAGRTQLVIAGVYAHIGCLATALDAFMADVQPFLALDAVADFSRAEHLMAASYLSQRCGLVTDTASIVAAWAGGTSAAKMAVPASLAALKASLAALLALPVAEIDDDAYLPDLGLDSIAVMQIAESWRELQISYVALFQDPSPRAWMDLVQQERSELGAA